MTDEAHNPEYLLVKGERVKVADLAEDYGKLRHEVVISGAREMEIMDAQLLRMGCFTS